MCGFCGVYMFNSDITIFLTIVIQVEPTELGDVTTGELSGDEEDEEASEKVEGPEIGVLVRLYSIHTRALQVRYLICENIIFIIRVF